MSDKPLVVVVNGYGTILDSPLGQVYLPRVKRVIEELKPALVVLCGGYTFAKTMPGVSEASVMFRWFEEAMNLRDKAGGPVFAIEDRSYTTMDNSREAAVVILKVFHGRPVRVVHCCEATRSANVVMCDRHFMMHSDHSVVESIDDITVETASWERADPFKQAKAMFYNWLAIRFPWLGLATRERRRRKKASRHR